MRYIDEPFRNLARAVVEQTARDFAQGLVQYRREVGSAKFNRRWLVRWAEFYADVDGETMARKIEKSAAAFITESRRVIETGEERPCPFCRYGTVFRRRMRDGRRLARCGVCCVTVTEES